MDKDVKNNGYQNWWCISCKNTIQNTKDYFWNQKNRNRFFKGLDKDKHKNCKNNVSLNDRDKKYIMKENCFIVKEITLKERLMIKM